MKRTVIGLVAVLVALLSAPTTSARSSQTRQLTFEDRVRAQEVIDRVYISHQVGAGEPLEAPLPRAETERKVREYLEKSDALEEFWSTPISSQSLAGELARVSRSTRLPERLEQIYHALNDDSILIQETFIRATLVNRLSRSFFAMDQRIHAEARKETSELHALLSDGLINPLDEHARRHEISVWRSTTDSPDEAVDALTGDTRMEQSQFARLRSIFPERVGEIGDVVEEREAFSIRVVLAEEEGWMRLVTYSVPKQAWENWWQSTESGFDPDRVRTVASEESLRSIAVRSTDGVSSGGTQQYLSAPCVPDDTWDSGALDDLPEPRLGHSMVWTGAVAIIWGGIPSGSRAYDTGSKYDPTTDSWASISAVNAPVARSDHSAIWTGTVMIVWGGSAPSGTRLSTGGRYNPIADTWTPTSPVNAPSARDTHAAVWTGTEMVIWGGRGDIFLTDTGGRYEPNSDTWRATATLNAPTPRWGQSAVWTGSTVVVWGGGTGTAMWFNTGGRYDPASDSWLPTSTTGAPSARERHSAVWTGTRMIVWGGHTGLFSSTIRVDSGGVYDPGADVWASTPVLNAPEARSYHSSVWTGQEMIVWGGIGRSGRGYLGSGARYDPASNVWSSMSAVNAPLKRVAPAVWTGALFITWGGSDGSVTSPQRFLDTGARYDPATDAWTPTSMTAAPEARFSHAGVWTGNEMIVWGGVDFTQHFFDSGGRYDPLLDAWLPTSITGSPTPRGAPTAVWTGKEMLVWGGYDLFDGLRTGGAYDPLTDRWRAISMTNAPTGRYFHTAVWTGARMVVWGGYNQNDRQLSSGGRYDPQTDSWSPTSTTGAPSTRERHSAVWTGTRMIVWGGRTPPGATSTGARYDPITDSWQATSTIGAAGSAFQHAAVWTGTEMIVWGGYGNFPPILSTGGRYDPVANTWRSMASVGAPSARAAPTALWTGNRVIIWGGGEAGGPFSRVGGRYDTLTDSWQPTTSIGAPLGRTEHTAFWTGSFMLVWGGYSDGEFRTGGRYALGHSLDNDGDGFSECAGDCRDADPGTNPGAMESCDGFDNDCDAFIDEDLGSTTCGVGACLNTVANCVDGVSQSCVPGTPTAEVCNGLDDDCDGGGDEDLGNSACGVGACSRTIPNCAGGVPQTCVPGSPTVESCNGIDDDCDGGVDEGLGTGTVGVSLDPVSLWPPNHRMVDIHATVTVSGGCPTACPTPPTVVLMSATSNEPDDGNGPGDGQTVDDIQDATPGSADFDLRMRAERDGTRNGRLYEVIYTATDCFGDTSVGSDGVLVPHDEGGQTEPVVLEVLPLQGGGTGSYALHWNSVAGANTYNVIRGRVSSIRAVGSFTVIEDSGCLARGLTTTSLSGVLLDENPAAGEAFFYLTEYVKGTNSGYGTEASGREMIIGSGDSCR